MDKKVYDYSLFSELFDIQPQAVVWLKPIWNKERTEVIDFEFSYCNDEALKYLNITREQQQGLLFSVSPTVSETLRKEFFAEMLSVYKTGTQVQSNIFNPKLNKYARVLRAKLWDGVLTIVQDRTEENRIIRELEQKTDELEKETIFSNSVIDASLNAIYVCEAIRDEKGAIIDFRITKVNRQYTKMFGYTTEYFADKTMLTVFPSMRASGHFEELCRDIENGKPVEREQHYDGEGINNWYQYSLVTISRDKAVVTISDITEQKRAMDQVEQQKTLLDNILKYSPAGISVTQVIRDKNRIPVDGRTIIANDKAIEYVGIPKDIFLSKTIREIEPTLFESPLYQMALRTLETGENFQTRYFLEVSSRWLDLSVAKLDNDHLINVFMDVTTTMEGQLRQEKLLEELRRSNINLEEFAYAASHDLKEPIRKVLIFSGMLKKKFEDEIDIEALNIFNRLEAANRRMNALVDDLLTYSQVGQRPNEFSEVDLSQVMKLILDDLELEIEEKKATVLIKPLPVVMGHQRQLQQLFVNLIGNALKYRQDAVDPRVEVSYRTVTGHDTKLNVAPEEMNRKFYCIEVKDNGIGFEQKDAERIFNVFQRLHGSKEFKGTGVGLAIARKVVENHGGYIAAESRPGEGSTFRVYLPAIVNG